MSSVSIVSDLLTKVNIIRKERRRTDTMPAKWTGELLGEMHLHGITSKRLAHEAGMHPKYVSTVLNGKRESKSAEEKLKAALQRLIDAEGEG